MQCMHNYQRVWNSIETSYLVLEILYIDIFPNINSTKFCLILISFLLIYVNYFSFVKFSLLVAAFKVLAQNKSGAQERFANLQRRMPHDG